MNKITLLPSIIDKIEKLILENNIVTPITLIQHSQSGIGSVLEMEFEIEIMPEGTRAMARVELSGVEDW